MKFTGLRMSKSSTALSRAVIGGFEPIAAFELDYVATTFP